MNPDTMGRVQQFFQDNAHLVGASALTLAGAAAASMYFTSKPEPFTPPIDLNNQSVVVDSKNHVRASGYCEDGKLMTYLYDDAKTTYEGFLRGLKVSKNGQCLGSRTGPNRSYKWQTYQEVLQRAQWFASGLIESGVKPGNSTFLGIYSGNCVEWALADLGGQMFSMVPVPLYDTLGLPACKYIINQTELCTMVCDDPAKTTKLLKESGGLKALKRIILIKNNVPDELRKVAKEQGIEVLTFKDVEEAGKKNTKEPQPPKPEDLATLCYTSGTTGDPKGVMLTHANFMICLSAVYFQAKGQFSLEPSDSHLSYLPLAHMFERGMHVMVFMHGAQIGYFSGDIRKLTEDLMELRPSLFPTVPRLLNRIYDKVQAGVRGSLLKSTLLKWAVAGKLLEVKQSIIRNDSIWDKLVFGKIQKMLGGRVRYIVTGSAPLSATVLDFTRCAFGCIVMEGYGQTESSAGITFNVPGETEAGNVGTPLACNYVKLVDVPEMDYHAKDGRGEVCAKGGNVMKGYYKSPDKTAEALDSQGWLHTGDIGMWLPTGALKIIDRKKNIFKLAQGEYVAVEKVENVYLKSKFVGQCFVEGDSFKPCLMAVVVPDEEVVVPFARNNGLPQDMEQFCKSKEAKELILKDMLAEGKANELKGFEQTKDVHLHPKLFSVEDGLLTPTMKNKRPALRKAFKQIVDDMYKKHDL